MLVPGRRPTRTVESKVPVAPQQVARGSLSSEREGEISDGEENDELQIHRLQQAASGGPLQALSEPDPAAASEPAAPEAVAAEGAAGVPLAADAVPAGAAEERRPLRDRVRHAMSELASRMSSRVVSPRASEPLYPSLEREELPAYVRLEESKQAPLQPGPVALYPNLHEAPPSYMQEQPAATAIRWQPDPAMESKSPPYALQEEPAVSIHAFDPPVAERAPPPHYAAALRTPTLDAEGRQRLQQSMRRHAAAHAVLGEFKIRKDGHVALDRVLSPGAARTRDLIGQVLALPAPVVDARGKMALLRALLSNVCTNRVGNWGELRAIHGCFEQVASATMEQLGAESAGAALALKCELFGCVDAAGGHWLGKTAMLLGIMMSHPPEGHGRNGAATMLAALGLNAAQVLQVLRLKASPGNLHAQAANALEDAMRGHVLLKYGGELDVQVSGYQPGFVRIDPLRMVFEDRHDSPHVGVLGWSSAPAQSHHGPSPGESYRLLYEGHAPAGKHLYLQHPDLLSRHLPRGREALQGFSCSGASQYPGDFHAHTHNGHRQMFKLQGAERHEHAFIFRDAHETFVHVHVFNGEPAQPLKEGFLESTVGVWKVMVERGDAISLTQAAEVFGALDMTAAELADFIETLQNPGQAGGTLRGQLDALASMARECDRTYENRWQPRRT